ncbi:hypothetical protein CJI97_005578 [Candidozyma auris]|nr:hypothetical protein CJI97_005578 [[Candida] auris]
MPEVAEVAHVCALLRRNVLGFKIREAKLNLDNLLFPALKTAKDPESTLSKFTEILTGSTISSIGRHGKYFWMRLLKPSQEPTVMLMHFGMTGMIKLRDIESHLIFMEGGGDKKVLDRIVQKDLSEGTTEDENSTKKGPKKAPIETDAQAEWPPRFTKFELKLENGYLEGNAESNGNGTEQVFKTLDFAFTDPRRLGRVRILSGPEYAADESLMQQEPLKALGPDYSKSADSISVKKEESEGIDSFHFGDPDPHHHGKPRLSQEEFAKLVLSKKKAIKSLLLDQEHFAGVGNWVSDEVLYHAKIHPNETISSKLDNPSDEVLQGLYDALIYVMEESVRVEGNVHKLPEHWLMIYRWGKGRKVKAKTKAGHVVDHITVGGRTSCFVPQIQKPLKKKIGKGLDEQQSKRLKSFKNEDDL